MNVSSRLAVAFPPGGAAARNQAGLGQRGILPAGVLRGRQIKRQATHVDAFAEMRRDAGSIPAASTNSHKASLGQDESKAGLFVSQSGQMQGDRKSAVGQDESNSGQAQTGTGTGACQADI